MRRPTLAVILTAAALTLGLLACGSADSTTAAGDTSASGKNGEDFSTGEPSEGSSSAAGGTGVALKKVGDFDTPVYVTGAPGFPKLLFVVEQGGRIVVLKDGKKLAKPFLDLGDRVLNEGERGLLSVAFAPDYKVSGRFYVYYTDQAGSITIDELRRANATSADPGSRRTVISIPHAENSNHNGGQLQFLGDLLYFGTGDGGSGGDPPNNAQNKNVLLGKLLRIDPRPSGGSPYSVPASNPFVGEPGRDEIYSYGLRNPFRFSFDTVTKPAQPRLTIGDVGQNRFEEVDYTPVGRAAGANFGWDALEGAAPYKDESSGTPNPGGTVKPILAYSHDRGPSCSITGGYVVADRALKSLYKRYVYADFCEGELRSLVPHLSRATGDRKLGLSVPAPSSFGEDTKHRLYVASIEGPVYRLVPR